MDSPMHSRILSESIVRTLAYYDLFDYPLTPEEIYRNLPTNHVNLTEIESELHSLSTKSIIFRLGAFFSLQNNLSLETRRLKGNLLAKKYKSIAIQKAKVIARFPFVQGVMISGSLSKGYADDQSDIDFFIITKPGRLWIARTLLVLYKRIFLFNSHKYFCVNYFIDSDHLEIEEKTLFTGTELATLIPLYGKHHYHSLIKNNSWLHQFFPNFRASDEPEIKVPDNFFKKAGEWILNHLFPGVLDRFFMQITLQRLKRMYPYFYPEDDFGIAFKTTRHVSKNHPKNYQRKIALLYDEKLEVMLKNFTMNSVA